MPPDRDELTAYGPLLSDNGVAWLGTAVLLRAPDAPELRVLAAAGAVIASDGEVLSL